MCTFCELPLCQKMHYETEKLSFAMQSYYMYYMRASTMPKKIKYNIYKTETLTRGTNYETFHSLMFIHILNVYKVNSLLFLVTRVHISEHSKNT